MPRLTPCRTDDPQSRPLARARHLTAVVTCALAIAAGSRELSAQPNPINATAAPGAIMRQTTVAAGTARFTVTRQVNRQGQRRVSLRVATDSGTFTLSGDSAVLADWADSAATLPDPPPATADTMRAIQFRQLKADGDSGAHMTFARPPSNHGAQLVLALFNGVWGIIQPLGDQAPAVLAALRGDSLTTADTAHTNSRARPLTAWAALCVQPHSASPADSPRDTACHGAHVWRNAAESPHTSHPIYPPALRRAGIAGGATLQFVIDTTGRVDPSSVQLLTATDPRFAFAVREGVLLMEFDPAQLDGREVPEIVQLPFTFAAHR